MLNDGFLGACVAHMFLSLSSLAWCLVLIPMFSILIYQKQAEAPKNVFLRSVELTLASCQAKLKKRPMAKGRQRFSAEASRKCIT